MNEKEMNDYEKAINWLCDQCYHLKIEHGNRCEWIGSCAHKERLQELVEKATPKKPIMYKPRSVERPYCGFCNLRLKKSWIVCPRCATRIDWGDNDE